MPFKFFSLLLIILSFISGFSQEQQLHIEYDFYFKNYYPEQRQITLVANAKESLSRLIRTINLKSYGETVSKPKSYYRYFYKNRDSLFYKARTNKKDLMVAESLNQLKWELKPFREASKILNYNYQTATTTFRGREYIAYFTTAIPFKAAPLKFHGLPGVMLAIESLDGQIQIQARKLEIRNTSQPIENHYAAIKNFITWEEFKKEVETSWEKFKNKVFSQSSAYRKGGASYGKPRISPELRLEVIIKPQEIVVENP